LNRVKNALLNKDVIIEQSSEIDRWLISKGVEAVTFSDGKTIALHTRVSASGLFEELIHYGQIKNRNVENCDDINVLILEIEAKEKLIKFKNAYKITEYEIINLTETLELYKIELSKIINGGS